MEIIEIFRSIQGESTLSGVPTLFIRCAGCNLNCSWCDTSYAQTGGKAYSIDSLIEKALSSGLGTVCITGGEPLIQKETPELADRLLSHNFTVSIETNGTKSVSALPGEAKAIIDVKCPGSGENGSFLLDNLKDCRPIDEFKFVIADRADFEYAQEFVKTHLLDTTNIILLSPANTLAPSVLSDWIVDEFPAARLNIQLHRVIWPNDIRGR